MSVVDSSSVWYTDQLITTHGLLASRVCSAPRTSGLWRLPGLAFNETFSDAALCWHGRGYKDCNKDIHIVYQVDNASTRALSWLKEARYYCFHI